VLSEFDAATLVGCPLKVYCADGTAKTAVSKGHDFLSNGLRICSPPLAISHQGLIISP
jgi:hypothetical protein